MTEKLANACALICTAVQIDIPGAILDTQMSVEFFVAFYSATLNIYISWYFFS